MINVKSKESKRRREEPSVSCASHHFLTGINGDLKQSWVILHNFLNDLSVCKWNYRVDDTGFRISFKKLTSSEAL